MLCLVLCRTLYIGDDSEGEPSSPGVVDDLVDGNVDEDDSDDDSSDVNDAKHMHGERNHQRRE